MSQHFFGPGRARGLQSLAIGAGALLSACATTPASTTQAPQAAAQNPVLQSVAAGALNTPLAVATPQGTQTVTVLSDYISGEGQECRAYTLAAAGALPAQKLACNDGTAWRDIPPLAPAANPGTLP
jgi:hypothetical protein